MVAFSFVAFSSKVEFALYSIAMALIQLTSSFQNAVVLTPLLANAPRLEGHEHDAFVRANTRMSLLLALAAAGAIVLLVSFVTMTQQRFDPFLAFACAIALFGGWSRDQRRTLHFSERKPVHALRGDAAYVVGLVSLLGIALIRDTGLRADVALTAWGIAGTVTGKFHIRDLASREPRSMAMSKVMKQQVSWTVPSAVLSWIQSSAYNFVAAAVTGVSSVADLNATRLVSTPMTVVQSAWNRIFIPEAGATIVRDGRDKAVRAGLRGAALLAIFSIVYALCVVSVLELLPRVGLLEHVERPGALVALWLLYTLLAGVRGIGTAFHIAETSFATLFGFGLTAAILGIASMAIGGSMWGAAGLLIGMLIGELSLGILLWTRILLGSGTWAQPRTPQVIEP